MGKNTELPKILLLSDTHSFINKDILKYVKTVDEVWHAGDIGDLAVTEAIQEFKPLVAVYGNIDGAEIRKEFPENQIFTRENTQILMTHIGGYPGRYPQMVRELIKSHSPHLFICGHSHILKVMYDEKYQMLSMNPGAIGKHGFHQKRTMLRFLIDQEGLKNLEVIEFER